MTTQPQLSTEDIQRLTDEYLTHVEKPAVKPQYLFMLGIIGQSGSGKSTVAGIIAKRIHGSVVMQSDDVRYIIAEERERTGKTIDWGDNVTAILIGAAATRLTEGYSVIFAGHTAQDTDREALKKLGEVCTVPVCYIRIRIDPATAKSRLEAKYKNQDWISEFGGFRVHTLEQMLVSIDERATLYKSLLATDIPGLLADVDNNGSLEAFEGQLNKIQVP